MELQGGGQQINGLMAIPSGEARAMCAKDYTLDIASVEIYPMPFFVKLTIADVGRATEWYVGALGFRALFVMRDPRTGRATTSHLRRERYQDILLVLGEHQKGRSDDGMTMNMGLSDGIDDLAERARAAGAEVVKGPSNTPWNTREVTFRDLDGYLMTFTSGPVAERTFDEVVGSMSEGTGE
jgi:uncharacterized glyoxalase superfamily protein PhnB